MKQYKLILTVFMIKNIIMTILALKIIKGLIRKYVSNVPQENTY